MKSKTVASIMRHVASKLPSIGADGEEIERDPAAEEHEKETKRNRRAAKKEAAAHDGEIEDEGAAISSSEEERLEQLYEKIGWPLGKTYGHPYDAFKLALTYVV